MNGKDEKVPDKSVYPILAESFKRASDKIEILPINKGGKHSFLNFRDLKEIINKYVNIDCQPESGSDCEAENDSESDLDEEEDDEEHGDLEEEVDDDDVKRNNGPKTVLDLEQAKRQRLD